MVSSIALGICCTLAWVNAALVTTSQGYGTVIIRQTLVRPAFQIRITFMVLLTDAEGLVILHLAEGVDATVLIGTRILTLPVDACLIPRAVLVSSAAGCMEKSENEEALETPLMSMKHLHRQARSGAATRRLMIHNQLLCKSSNSWPRFGRTRDDICFKGCIRYDRSRADHAQI